MSSLAIDAVSKRFGSIAAIERVSFNVAKGEFVCLLGPSGCGKSTLLRTIAGFETRRQGDIRIDGKSIVHLSPERRPTAMVFQSHALWPHMTVFGNIAFGICGFGVTPSRVLRQKLSRKRSRSSAFPVTWRIATPKNCLWRSAATRCGIARCLVLEPKILPHGRTLSAAWTPIYAYACARRFTLCNAGWALQRFLSRTIKKRP